MTLDTPPRGKRSTLRKLPWILTGAVAALLLGLGVGVLVRPYVFSGSVIRSSTPAPSMAGLIYDNGEPVDLNALHGQVILVYFGYTHCPDLCPTMLTTVNRALDGLGERGARVTTLMVTVDPERDQPALLGAYVRHFDAAFQGVWGDDSTVRSVATQYGVFFESEDPDSSGNYDVAHTAGLLAIDPTGVLRLTYPAGLAAEDLERDLAELLG